MPPIITQLRRDGSWTRGISSARSLLLAAVVTTLAAPPALAADQQTVSAAHDTAFFKGKFGSGFVYGYDGASRIPQCTPGVFDCERTLVKVEDFGKLVFSVASDPAANPALRDIDLHVYKSDALGTQGAFVGESTSAGTDEAVTISDRRSVAGQYYLVIVDWYLGAGDYDGKIKLTPRPT